MPAVNLDSSPEKPAPSPEVKFYWWEITMITVSALIGLAFSEVAIGTAIGLVCSSAISTYVDRKNPKSPTLLRIAGVVLAVVALARYS